MQTSTLFNSIGAGLLVLTCTALVVKPTETFASEQIKFIGNTQYAGFCEAVVHDDVEALQKNVTRQVGKLASSKEAVIKLVIAEDGLRCNGENLVSFAQRRGAQTVHDFLLARQLYE